MLPRGWKLTWVLSLGLLAMSAWVLAVWGAEEAGVRTWIRATARSSAFLFLLTFIARPLHRLAASEQTRWLLKNRRFLGVSVGVSHFLHLIGILWLTNVWPENSQVDIVTLIGGGLGFFFLFAMTLTSSNAAVAALGKNWRRLHKTGAWYVWFIFVFTGVPQELFSIRTLMEAGMLGALALRVVAHFRPRQA